VTARTMWSFGSGRAIIVQNGLPYGLWVAGMSSHTSRAPRLLRIPSGQHDGRQLTTLNRVRRFCFVPFLCPLYCRESEGARDLPQEIILRLGWFGGEGGTETTPPAGR